MATIDSQRFQIESTLDLAADGFSAEVPGAGDFLDAADGDTISLEAGFIDPTDQERYTVGQTVGPVDEYEVSVSPDRITGRLRGRDQMADALQRTYRKRYLRTQPTPAEKTAMDDHTFAGEADPIVYAVGEFRASDVAKEVATLCGLTLSWECRDYTLLEDFEASGRPVDILRQLVEPWSQVESTKVDIAVQGTALLIRPRPTTLAATDTFDHKDARIKALTVRRRRADRYGRVTLQGKMVPKGLTGGGVTVYQPTEVEETSTSETKDEAGNVQQRVIRTTTYRMPERIILRYREQQYDRQVGALKLVKDEQRENEYETIQYDASGAQSHPKQLRALTLVRGIYPKDQTFREIRKEEVIYSYAATDGYQDMTTTRKWEIKFRPAETLPGGTEVPARATLEEVERIVKTLKEGEFLKTEEVTSVYKRAKSGAFPLVFQESTVSSGLRPGGPRPGRTIVIGGGDEGPQEPLTLEEKISDHPWAVDVAYSNPHMTQEDLDFIMAQFRDASGLWRYELSMQYMAMPWLRKSHVLAITGLKDETGLRDIPIGPALVSSRTLSFDEGSASPSMVSNLQAVWWSA